MDFIYDLRYVAQQWRLYCSTTRSIFICFTTRQVARLPEEKKKKKGGKGVSTCGGRGTQTGRLRPSVLAAMTSRYTGVKTYSSATAPVPLVCTATYLQRRVREGERGERARGKKERGKKERKRGRRQSEKEERERKAIPLTDASPVVFQLRVTTHNEP